MPASENITSSSPEQSLGETATGEAIRLSTIDFLISEKAQAELEWLARQESIQDTLATLNMLRQQYTSQEAGALLALVRLRKAAVGKFPQAHRLFFTQEALEQATPFAVAAYRAHKLGQLTSPGPLLDLGSGIGGDALALAEQRPVHAYERDPLRCRMLAANARAFGPNHAVTVHCEDWRVALNENRLAHGVAAFIDPPRRLDGRRLMRLDQVLPSWDPIERLLGLCNVICIKLMPGIAAEDIPPDAALEFVSHQGVCKEAVLWLGRDIQPLRRAAVYNPTFQTQGAPDGAQPAAHATLDQHCAAHWHTLVSSGVRPPVGTLQTGQILYEPDPAVIRAGAFYELCELLHASLLDSQIAYLISNRTDGPPVATPFATPFRILEIHAYSLRRLNQRLAELKIGTIELKKRGVPFEPESLRPRLKLTPGGAAAVVIFTRQGDRRIMLLAQRVSQ